MSIDSGAGTLVLKIKSGADVTYHITDKTHVLKEKRVVEATAFHAGELAVVRFRKSSAGPASLYDLADKTSWEWLNRLRHETTMVTLAEATDEELKVTEGSDKAETQYRITEKTAWQKNGKSATAADFKAGDHLYVVPRLLPGGNIMAMAVSDAPEGAAMLKERSKATLSGSLKLVNTEKRTILLHTVAGEDRDLTLAPDCVVRMFSKDVPLTTLRPGLPVSVHLTHSAENELEVSRVTIQSKKGSARRSSTRTAKPAMKPNLKPVPKP